MQWADLVRDIKFYLVVNHLGDFMQIATVIALHGDFCGDSDQAKCVHVTMAPTENDHQRVNIPHGYISHLNDF